MKEEKLVHVNLVLEQLDNCTWLVRHGGDEFDRNAKRHAFMTYDQAEDYAVAVLKECFAKARVQVEQ